VLFPQCPFCNHANPAGAKYCNDCGSPLHLKPCDQCEAINDLVASDCYSCGTEFPVASAAPEAAALVSPALNTTAASATLSDTGLGRAPPFESLAESHDIPLRGRGNETAGRTRDYTVEVVAREPRPLDGGVASLFSAAQQVVPLLDLGFAPRRRPLPRLALAVVLPAALLTAVGVSAYYVYRHQVQPSGSLSSGPPDPAARTGVTASSVSQNAKGMIGTDGVNGQGPTPRQTPAVTPPPRVSTTDHAAPAQQPVSAAVGVARAPGAETAIAAEPPHKTTRVAASRVAPVRSAAGPSTSTYRAAAAAAPMQLPLSNSRVNVPPDAPRPTACTEAIAALGLCSLPSRRESK